MIKKFASLIIATGLAATSAFGAAGIFDPYAIVNDQFYDIGGASINPDFQGANLGEFDTSMSIELGGQQKTFKNNGTDVTGSALQYRIYLTGSPTGSFTTVVEPFQFDLGNPGDQQWGTDAQGSNTTDQSVTISLANFAPGAYTLEVYSLITTNGVDAASTIDNNNGGANFTANFTVVPEPSSLSLLAGPAILGAWFYVRRRRA